jgi:MFS family permease
VTPVQPAASRSQWLLLALLVISVSINYVDRGNLSVAAATTAFRHDLGLDNRDLGILFGAFFLTYSLFQIAAGWLVDRFNVYLIFSAGFVLWSAATILTGFSGGFAALLAFRLLLGLGEACAYPAYSRMIYAGFREHERGFANALIDAGSRTGPAIGVLTGGLILTRFDWRVLFIAIGSVGCLWLIPWVWFLRHPSGGFERPSRATGGPGFGAILRKREAWGTIIGLFCLNYSWVFILNWLTAYLTQERHYSTRMMAWYGSLPFWGVAATTVLFGWFSDRAIRRGASPTRVRLGAVCGGMLVNTLMLVAYAIPNQIVSMAVLIVACLALGVTSSNFWAVTQSLAGRDAVGKWTGLQNGIGNLAGIVGPYLTGVMLARTGSFLLPFAAACFMAALGAVCYWWMVRRVAPVDWN